MVVKKRRPLAVFIMKKYQKIGDFVFRMRTISLNLADDINGYFATPAPPVATVDTHITTLEAAQTVAGTRATGSIAARDLARDVVVGDKNAWVAYVQGLADAAPDTETAIAIIQSSGLDVKVNGKFLKPPLAAKNGQTSGQVKLAAKSAGARSSYDWEYSLDSGANWIRIDSTIQAKTMISGLTVGNVVAFRYRAVTKTGAGKWSDVVVWVVQ